MKTAIYWWEKTVEYAFIQRHISINSMIAPLDGHHERAGDAIFSVEDRWLIVEFKRNTESIDDEISKFTDYYLAREHLGNGDSHHLVIYGYENNGSLELGGRTYFSEQDINVSDFAAMGISLEEFKPYLEDLIRYKKGSAAGSGGRFGSVAVVAKSEEGVYCMSFEEFGIAMEMSIAIDIPSVDVDPPSHHSSM